MSIFPKEYDLNETQVLLFDLIVKAGKKVTRLREVQRFEQFFGIGAETKVEDVRKVGAVVESNPWIRKLVDLLEDIRSKKFLIVAVAWGT